MTFFYDLNKRLAALAEKQDLHESKVAESEKWIQKAVNPAHKGGLHKALHVAQGEKIPKAKIDKATHSKNPKLRHMAQFAKNVANEGNIDQLEKDVADAPVEPIADMEESALQAYLGNKKYGKQGMEALRKAGREHASKSKMDQIRNRYNKMDDANMDEGNAFSGALANAKKDHKSEFEVDGKKYKVVEADPVGLEEKKAKPDFLDIDGDGNKKETFKKAVSDKKKSEPRSKGTAFDPETAKGMFAHTDEHPRHNVKDTGYSKRYTRKHEDDMEKDDEVKSDAPKKKGRPKGPAKGPERTTKGAWKHKGERKVKEDGIPVTDRGEYDNEGSEVKGDMHTVIRHATELEKHLRDQENLPTWVIEKIGQIKGMMASVSDYILSQHERGVEQDTGKEGVRIAEKAVSKKQQRFMGMVDAMQKGEKVKNASPELKKVAKTMKHKDAHDFAATKHKGLPEKVKSKKESNEEVEETTVAGSVATASASKPGKGSMQFGKGVYESFNNSVEQLINESIDISMSKQIGDGHENQSNITINASGSEADMLKDLLKMAGINIHGSSESACGSEELEENQPDWPTNTETLDAEPNLHTYSGGLNAPKSTGQSTTIGGGLPNLQARRQVSMEENMQLEHSLFKLYKDYKAK